MLDLHDGYTGERIRGTARRYMVFAPDGTALGSASSDACAASMVDRHMKAAKAKVRPCLCCQRDFRSEGPHNRLCKPCRERSEGML